MMQAEQKNGRSTTYINKKVVFGHWKDVGLRLEGEAVCELTKLFLTDYGINVCKLPKAKQNYFPE